MSTTDKVRDAGAVKNRNTSPEHAKSKGSFAAFVIAAALSLVGLADALYLTVQHVAGRSVRCTVTTGCDEVLASAYAVLPGGVPLAALGTFAYFAVFSLATLAAFDYEWARTPLAALVALMLATTLWLLFLQAFILEKFCEFCLLSAAVTISLSVLVVITWRARRT
ncbi:MAG TPA: vitamin K epoxide reductase family protein [Pyrinomonadaceae bacterium]|nr:vitamin K epoxide reductase family protein [Pyrinomonadaceae bacterium]